MHFSSSLSCFSAYPVTLDLRLTPLPPRQSLLTIKISTVPSIATPCDNGPGTPPTTGCRLVDWIVNFTELGITESVLPQTVNLFACAGQCADCSGSNFKSMRAHVATVWHAVCHNRTVSKANDVCLTCQPDKFKPMHALVRSTDGSLHLSTYPDTIPTRCSCVM